MTDDLIWYTHTHTIPAALSLLPGRMDSRAARAMLLAIGLQESHFEARRQFGGGPARGFWQFELAGGVTGVLTHPQTKPFILPICELLLYEPQARICHAIIEHHDVLAACFARLLLWTDPQVLPAPDQPAKGWAIYLRQWRPGRPHPDTWPANFTRAWEIVEGGEHTDVVRTGEASPAADR